MTETVYILTVYSQTQNDVGPSNSFFNSPPKDAISHCIVLDTADTYIACRTIWHDSIPQTTYVTLKTSNEVFSNFEAAWRSATGNESYQIYKRTTTIREESRFSMSDEAFDENESSEILEDQSSTTTMEKDPRFAWSYDAFDEKDSSNPKEFKSYINYLLNPYNDAIV
jgi:hypothetical protein